MTAAGSGNVWLAGCVTVVAGGGCSVAAVSGEDAGRAAPTLDLIKCGPGQSSPV